MKQIAFLVSLALIFVIPWENSVQISGIGTVSRLVGLVAAAVWFLAVVVEGKMRQPTLFHALATAFVGWSALSLFWSLDPAATVRWLKTYVQLLVLAYLIWDLYPTARAIRAGLQAYVLGAWVAIVSISINFLAGNTASFNRYSVHGFNADDAGLVLALGMPIAWGLGILQFRQRQAGPLKWLNLAYLPLAFLGITLTGTRMALIATVPAILFGIVSLGNLRRRQRVFISLLAIAGILAIIPFIPANSVERLLTTGQEISTGALGGRSHIWRMGLQTFAEHPVLGVGSGAFKTAVGIGNVAHNTFVSILTETGIVGLALFLGMVGFSVIQAQKHPPTGVRFWLTLLAIWGLGASTLSLETRKVTWLVLSLAAAAGAVQQEAKHEVEVVSAGRM